MYLRITAQGNRAEELGALLGQVGEKMNVREAPNARLRLIQEASFPGSITFTLLAYPEPATDWPAESADLQIADYVKTRVMALSPLFRSFLNQAFGEAITPVARHELAQTPFELQAEIAPLEVNALNPQIRALFEPLGYRVEVEYPVFGLQAILVRLIGKQTIPVVLQQLFALVPALDRAKQAPLTRTQVLRLRQICDPWLSTHPKREFVARSYRLRLATLLGTELTLTGAPSRP